MPLNALSLRLLYVLGIGARRFWHGADSSLPEPLFRPIVPDEIRSLLQLAQRSRLERLAVLGLLELFDEQCVLDAVSVKLDRAESLRGAQLHSMLMEQDRTRLIALLSAVDIDFTFTKGALADVRFWRNSGLRGGSDIDVLVYKKDLIKIHEILLREQYSLRGNVNRPATWAAKSERHYQNTQHRFDFDVHYELGKHPPYGRCGAAVLGRAHEKYAVSIFDDENEKKSRTSLMRGLHPSDWLATLALNMAAEKFDGRLTSALDALALTTFCPEHVERGVSLAVRLGAGWGVWGLYRLVTKGLLGQWPGGAPACGISAAQKRVVDGLLGIVPQKRALKYGYQRMLFIEWPLLGTGPVVRDIKQRLLHRVQDVWSQRPHF